MPPSRNTEVSMIPDLTPIFARYEALAAEADALFTRVHDAYPQCVTCARGCSDCCHALFDLSLVEAMYLNRAFIAAYDYGRERSDILERAAETDRRTTRLKREMYRASREGKSPEEIMEDAARLRVRCPLLGTDESCLLYGQRPVTCRLYGVPSAIAGKGHVCGKTAFVKGAPYPTVNMDKIQDRLAGLSQDIADAVQSRFTELHQVYVPVSMALITRYDEAYLGIGPAPKED